MSFQQGHALLIGVGTHQYHPSLDVPITVADAKAVQQVLQDANLCGYPSNQVQFLKEKTATKAGILSALDNLSQLQVADTLFLFFCGHGSLGTDGRYYLLTHDVRISGNRVQAGSGVSETELLNKLNAIPAKRLFMVFNACHSGHIATDTLAADKKMPETLNPSGTTANALLGTGEGRILIVACHEQQYSYIGPGPITIFTKALTDGLKGEANNNGGTISAFGLYEHLYHEVKETVEDNYSRVQEPVLTVIRGVGPFPVALYRGASTLGAFTDDSSALENTAIQEVSPRKVERSFTRIINTMGAAYVGGNVKTNGGDFYGGSKVVYGDEVRGDKVGGDKVQGDQVVMSGDFRGAIVNVKSRLEEVSQMINSLSHGDDKQKEMLNQLIEQLIAELEKTPPEHVKEAEKVSKRVEAMARELDEEEPDKEMVEITGESLKKAAQNIAGILPNAIDIATKIVTAALAFLA